MFDYLYKVPDKQSYTFKKLSVMFSIIVNMVFNRF